MNFKKSLATLGILGLLVALAYSSNVALGWTNPPANPPGGSGAITAYNGNVGINFPTPITAPLVVNSGGAIAVDVAPAGALSDIIGLPAVPAGPTAAASKAYVDAQAGGGGGGGGKPVITIYGMSGGAGPWAVWKSFPPNFTIVNCMRGNWDACFSGLNSMPGAGAGVTCPTGWNSVFAGFGPYAFLEKQYYYRNSTSPYGGGPIQSDEDPFDDFTPEDPPAIPSTHVSNSQVGITYSVCGATSVLLAKTDFSVLSSVLMPGSNGIGAYAGVVSACVPQANNTYVCNTCRICQQQ